MKDRSRDPFASSAAFTRSITRMLRRIREPDLEHIVWRYLATLPGPHGSSCSLAWHYVEVYLAAAGEQVHRIERGRRAIELRMERLREDRDYAFPGQRRRAGENIWADGHFYFICWNAVCRLLRHIESACQLRELKAYMRMKRAVIERHIEIRGHLEHWTERLPGGRKDHVLHRIPGRSLEPRLPGGYYFGLGGKNYDMSKKSLRDLTSLVHGFRDVLVSAAQVGKPLGGKAPRTATVPHRRA